MREVRHGRRTGLLVATAMLSVVIPGPTGATDPSTEGLLQCPTVERTAGGPRVPRSFDWSGSVDANGTLRGHTLRFAGGRTWRAGPRGFADGPFRERLVTGERDDAGTTVRVVDLDAGCVRRSMRFGDLVYGSVVAPDGTLYVSTVAAGDRRELGVWRLAADDDEPQRVVPPPTGRIATAVPRTLDLALTDVGVRATWCAADGCVTGESRTDHGRHDGRPRPGCRCHGGPADARPDPGAHP